LLLFLSKSGFHRALSTTYQVKLRFFYGFESIVDNYVTSKIID